MLLERRFALALLLSLIALAVIIPMQQALAEPPQDRLKPGDVLQLVSVRGVASGRNGDGLTEAKVSLKLTVTNVNQTRLKFTVTSGEIAFGDKVYTVTSGQGGAILRKFGWIILRGDATLTDGEEFKFRLEGMLHFERAGVVLAGLTGGLGNDSAQSRLRLLVRLSKG